MPASASRVMAVPTSMNGRRRPSRERTRSLQAPIKGGTRMPASDPSPMTSPTAVPLSASGTSTTTWLCTSTARMAPHIRLVENQKALR